MYPLWLVTSYSCTFFMLWVWTYYWWFGYPLVLMLVQVWTHYSPWYFLAYCCNYCFGELNTCIEKGFPPFPPPHSTSNRYTYHERTLANVIIIDPTCPNMVQHAFSMTMHATIVVQEKTWSYAKHTFKDDVIPLVIWFLFLFQPFVE